MKLTHKKLDDNWLKFVFSCNRCQEIVYVQINEPTFESAKSELRKSKKLCKKCKSSKKVISKSEKKLVRDFNKQIYNVKVIKVENV